MVLALGAGWALVKVGLVLAVILGALTLANRRVRARAGEDGRSCVRLTAQHSVHVVEVEGRRLLVGVGPTGAPHLLCDLDADASPHDGEVVEPGAGVGWDGR